MQIGNGTTDGSISTSSNIVNNAALVYNIVGLQSYGGPINGTGTLTKTGTGTPTLTNTGSSFTGNVTINGGSLQANGVGGGTNSLLGAANVARNVAVNNGRNCNSATTTLLATTAQPLL